jgi:hypothetical protein
LCSEPDITPARLNNCLAALAHVSYKVAALLQGKLSPGSFDISPQLVWVSGLGVTLVEGTSELRPEVFDWIKVRGLRWPVE